MPVASWKPEEYRRLVERLKAARLEAGLSQVQVAEALGVPQQHVSRVELGERRVDPTELAELARLYGKPLAYFLEEG